MEGQGAQNARKLILVLTDGREAYDPAARLKVAWRREGDASGICPVCGATMAAPNRAERRELRRRYGPQTRHFRHVVMRHEHDCPVGDGPLRVAS